MNVITPDLGEVGSYYIMNREHELHIFQQEAKLFRLIFEEQFGADGLIYPVQLPDS